MKAVNTESFDRTQFGLEVDSQNDNAPQNYYKTTRINLNPSDTYFKLNETQAINGAPFTKDFNSFIYGASYSNPLDEELISMR